MGNVFVIVDGTDQVEAKTKTTTTIAVTLRQNLENLEATIHMLDTYPNLRQRTIFTTLLPSQLTLLFTQARTTVFTMRNNAIFMIFLYANIA